MIVPFLDLRSLHEPLMDEFNAAIREVIEKSSFAGGPYVEAFENEFAPYCQCQNAIGVGSGTDALWLALLALGVKPGDEVITTPNTFIATAEAITYVGATPVFVDIDESSYNLDPKLIEKAITPKTKAIIPVDLYGQMADLDPILEIAKRHGLVVIEDASQAHGAEYKGKRAGSICHAGCFSFYPGKNLGAFGEAGAVVTNDTALATKIRALRDHGQDKKYYHKYVGWNGRMDGIQGAVLSIKLRHLDKSNEQRRTHARAYSTGLKDVPGIILPAQHTDFRHVFHLFAIRIISQNRDDFLEAMKQKGICCAIHYPVPLHLQEAYQHLRLPRGSFPVAERCMEQIVSLPMFADLAEEQIDKVVHEVRNYIGNNS